MRQFLLPPDYAGENEIVIHGNDHHYLKNVLRIKTGERFMGIDRSGTQYILSAVKISSDASYFTVQKGRRHNATENERAITLFQCLPKGKKMEQIIRQAVEAGISQIIPLESDYSIPKIKDLEMEKKVHKWNRIVKEAVQQCGAPSIPQMQKPLKLAEIEGIWPKSEPGIFFHQKPLDNKTLHEYLSACSKKIAIVIGPEGGFSEKEIHFLLEYGFKPVYLGPTVLRTETAALFAIAAVKIIVLENSSWKVQSQKKPGSNY
ncbi:MAG: RsmE family RNA methyltransferase [Spirochaetota bacterium]